MATQILEHLIRDERDYEQHVDYVHYNPVKQKIQVSIVILEIGSLTTTGAPQIYCKEITMVNARNVLNFLHS